uniref:Uncharacterized protein n=1 Tax=Cucumis melo TaxID=3656 RepID=A0A9I9DIP8_CUCME
MRRRKRLQNIAITYDGDQFHVGGGSSTIFNGDTPSLTMMPRVQESSSYGFRVIRI